MKKRIYVLIILVVFFALAVAAGISFLILEGGRPAPAVPAHAYLELSLSGPLPEISSPDLFTVLFQRRRPLSMNEIWMNIRKAKADNRVQALLLRLDMMECGWAKATEIREMILDFRKSGKKAYVYIEEVPNFDKEYYLATACDKIIFHPLGWLGINGIGGDVPFFKNTLDKLGIQAEIEHVEEYKTAYNSFTEKGFTPAHKEMMESLYGDIFARYVKTIAEARKKSETEVKALIDQGFFLGENALKAGLVDETLYEDELQNVLQSGGQKLRRLSFEEYSRVNPRTVGLDRGRKIALIYGSGTIFNGESIAENMGSATVSRWIRKAREDKSLAAIIFRVDSPGGSAEASDVIWREIFLAKKEKPFIVSMSDMAGSGGYWISMAAHKIVAQPQTLTGSIGVLGGKFNMAGLYEKIGVSSEKLFYGDKADFFSSFHPFSPEEKKLLKDQLLWTYDHFLTKAAEGRKLTKDDVDRIGRGRVWTGSQAKENKLVDELGGLNKALELAKNMAGIPQQEEVRLIVWPAKKSIWEVIFGGRTSDACLGVHPELQKIIDILKPLEKSRLWAIMPFRIEPE